MPETTLPLVTAIAPAALAIVALAWADASIAPLALDLTSVRFVVLAVAIASIFLASVAAFIQDDIEHIVGYAIVGDAGVVMLAVAALDPAAWAPARIWILAFVVARSAFAAWAAATRATFGTGRVAELRGWALRAPILGVVLGLVVVASIGLPGLAAAEARGQLISLVLEGPVAAIVMLGTLSPLLYYGRLFAVGHRPDRGHRACRLAPSLRSHRSDQCPCLARACVGGQPERHRDSGRGGAGDPRPVRLRRGIRRATGGRGATAGRRRERRILRAG